MHFCVILLYNLVAFINAQKLYNQFMSEGYFQCPYHLQHLLLLVYYLLKYLSLISPEWVALLDELVLLLL